jgi:hypothetical protein
MQARRHQDLAHTLKSAKIFNKLTHIDLLSSPAKAGFEDAEVGSRQFQFPSMLQLALISHSGFRQGLNWHAGQLWQGWRGEWDGILMKG